MQSVWIIVLLSLVLIGLIVAILMLSDVRNKLISGQREQRVNNEEVAENLDSIESTLNEIKTAVGEIDGDTTSLLDKIEDLENDDSVPPALAQKIADIKALATTVSESATTLNNRVNPDSGDEGGSGSEGGDQGEP